MGEVTISNERLPVKESIIDRVISAFSPKAGVNRLAARIQEAQAHKLAASLGYVGGRFDRKSLQEWNPYSGSANDEFLGQSDTIRGRSRDLTRNSPVASGASNTAVTHVIGTGLRLHARVDSEFLGIDEEQAEEKQRELERVWRMVKDRLDYEGDVTMMDLQQMTFRGVFESGDILAIRRRDMRAGDIIPLKVQLVEADRISNPDNRMDSQKISGGVEVNAKGVTTAYHVSDRHPGDLTLGTMMKWDRAPKDGRSGVPLSRLIFDKRRPGQRRGVPALAPVIEPLKQITRLTDYELTASVVASLFTVFVKTEAPVSGGLPVAPEGTPEAEKPTKTGDVFMNPGAVIDLRPGEEIQTASPNRPSGAFDPFFRAIVQQIGMAIEIPYEVLMHLYGSSYSAARAALLDAWRFFRARRAWIAQNFCQMVYEWVVIDAIAEGLIDLPGFLTDDMTKAAWLGADWVGDSPGAINEKDAVDAAIARVDSGLSDRAYETAEISGRDWGNVQKQRAYEKKRIEEDGMDFLAKPVSMKGDEGDVDVEEEAGQQKKLNNGEEAA